MTDSPADAGSEPEAEETPEPFANRAARRAKGKASGKPAQGSGGQRQLRSGNVQSPRQYGNRRSG
ncbi:hypothetical protein [Actinoplanes sp. M2I2]|uniref:hypothetical protein n=1 Tax=Actinoplanes sp. M2I2 TaxID=1734444 RepID=UPI0020226B7F|nr:hypothetical protein [Actinoplanes sp. M2I2]